MTDDRRGYGRVYVGAHRNATGATEAPVAAPAPGASYRTVLRNREFRAMWAAIAQSQFGDQLGRVALSILVFTSTGSGLATASVYALTYLPTVVGGLLLSGLADRYPRRGLLVICDLLRAALFVCMAIPAVPVVGVALLLTLAVVVGAPHKAAEPAIVADLFEGDDYASALGIRTATVQAAQLAGFALGGVLVAVIGARAALAIDAATFAGSAALLGIFLRPRPAAAAQGTRGTGAARAGIVAVWRDARLRALLGFSWLAGCWVVPEGIAAPYADEHGGGPMAVGVLLAADPIGAAIGSLLLTRLITGPRRAAALGPLALGCGIPLIATVPGPGIPVTVVLWAVCGALSSYQVFVIAEFVGIVPSDRRGQAIGIAASGLVAVQGVGVLVGGALAAWLGTAPAVAVAGAAGTVLAVLVTHSWAGAQHAYRQTVPSART